MERARLLGGLAAYLALGLLGLAVAGTMPYLAATEHPAWMFIAGAVVATPLGLVMTAASVFRLLPLALDLAARPIAVETTVTGKSRQAVTVQYAGTTYIHQMSFGSPVAGVFDVKHREFHSFDQGDRVALRYFPRSKTIVSIRKA